MEWLMMVLPLMICVIMMLFFMPIWIKKCRELGLVWGDMNKFGHPKNVATSGGIIFIMSFLVSALCYVAFRTLLRESFEINMQIFAILCSILIFALIGIVDDMLGWKSGGLSKRVRVFLGFFATIPLIVINAGSSSIVLPFFGIVDLGIIFPLIIIPIAIVGAGTTYNFLAGFNGLEAGQGAIILSFLSFVAYFNGKPWLAFLGLIMVVALIVFYFYNKVPAKVFPKDALTYCVGAMIAIMAIVGNFERIALFVLIPFIVEVLLKLRGGLKKQSFGIPQKDGSLKMPYDKIYGLTHFSIWFLGKIKKKVYEKEVVYFIFCIHLIFILLAFWIFLL